MSNIKFNAELRKEFLTIARILHDAKENASFVKCENKHFTDYIYCALAMESKAKGKKQQKAIHTIASYISNNDSWFLGEGYIFMSEATQEILWQSYQNYLAWAFSLPESYEE